MKRFGMLITLIALLAAGVVLAQMNDPDPGKTVKCAADQAATMTQAPGCCPGHGHGAGHGMCGILECKKDLGLTDDQVAKIKQINFDHQNLMIGLKADMEKARLNERHEMNSDNPDKSKVLAATKQINDIQGKIELAQVEHRFAMRGVLNKEQLAKWKECQHMCKDRCQGPCGAGSKGFGPSGCAMPQGQQMGCGMSPGGKMCCGTPQGAKMGCGH